METVNIAIISTEINTIKKKLRLSLRQIQSMWEARLPLKAEEYSNIN